MATERKMYIGALIRQARKNKGITSVQLASMLEPPRKPQTVTAWERGVSSPDAESISQISRILGIDARSFYGQCDEDGYQVISLQDPIRKDMEAFEDCYTRMTDTQRKAVLAVASAMVDC